MKKIISILVALGVVLSMSVVATPVYAGCDGDAPINCSVTNTTPSVACENTTYNVTFTTVNGLSAGDKVVITFPTTADVSTAYCQLGVWPAAPAAIGSLVVSAGEIHITLTSAISGGSTVTVLVYSVLNPATPATYNVCVKTTWDACNCCDTIAVVEGGDIIPPTYDVWCPCHDIVLGINWGVSSNITAVNNGTWGTDFVVDVAGATLTIKCSWLSTLGLNTCAEHTFNIDFDPGCNRTYTVKIAEACNITLNNGWNLMSMPLIPYQATFGDYEAPIEDVLADVIANVVSVWYYDGCDGTWGAWHANGDADFGLANMAYCDAYWVCMNATRWINQCGYKIPCPPAGPPCCCYCNCWNMVGYHSCTTMNRTAYLANLIPAGCCFGAVGYHTVGGWYNLNAGTNMNPGEGFFMAFTAANACFAPPV